MKCGTVTMNTNTLAAQGVARYGTNNFSFSLFSPDCRRSSVWPAVLSSVCIQNAGARACADLQLEFISDEFLNTCCTYTIH